MALDQTNDDPGSQEDAKRPDLCDRGHVVVFTRSYYHSVTGSAVVMRNLLSRFNPESYSLIVSDLRGPLAAPVDPGVRVYPLDVTVPAFFPGRFDHLWRQHEPFLPLKVKRLIKSLSPAVIVGVFPDLKFLSFARGAAKALRIPWLAYLHDTIVEVLRHTKYAGWTRDLQPKVFAEASSILVTGEGMKAFYKKKYRVDCLPIQIGYPEPIPEALPEDRDVRRQAFMGGSVYEVNARAVKRALTALEEVNCPFVLATMSTDETLARYGVTGECVRKEFIRDRPEYLETLRRQGVLIVLMDWPDESEINGEELSTAFPTKAVEYLASGRPILVHCPENYFLAQFFLEHRCGLVVTERDHKALVDAVNRLLQGDDEVIEMRKAALAAAQLYSIDRLAPAFQSEINAVSRLHWGEKVSS
ncbi:MAG: hypothetical protein NTU88_12100 [Armatimonadetes bacterium]|nr:hypothetical protein [Armatimonadota bacterium]